VATTITWLYAAYLPQAPKRRYAAQTTTEFSFADVRRASAMALAGRVLVSLAIQRVNQRQYRSSPQCCDSWHDGN